jgi:hypothetical protein
MAWLQCGHERRHTVAEDCRFTVLIQFLQTCWPAKQLIIDEDHSRMSIDMDFRHHHLPYNFYSRYYQSSCKRERERRERVRGEREVTKQGEGEREGK